MNLTSRSRVGLVAGVAVLGLSAGPAQAGWGPVRAVDARRDSGDTLAAASSTRGHTVVAWTRGAGLRVAAARRGGGFGRSHRVPGSDTAFSVRLAVAPDGRALLAFAYEDGTTPGGLEDRGSGCCAGIKVAVVSAAGRPTTARAVSPRGSTVYLGALAASANRFAVLVDGGFGFQGPVSFIAVSRSGQPGSPRAVAGASTRGATLQFRGRRAVAGVIREGSSVIADARQRADGRFGPLRTLLRLPASPPLGTSDMILTPDGRGGQVLVHRAGALAVSRVSALLLTPGGRAVPLAAPSSPASDVALIAPAVAGGSLAVGWIEDGPGSRVRLLLRHGTGPVLRRTLPALGRRVRELSMALGGRRVALAGNERVFPATPPIGVNVSSRATSRRRLGRAGGTFPTPAVVVEPGGRARYLWRDTEGRVFTRVHTP